MLVKTGSLRYGNTILIVVLQNAQMRCINLPSCLKEDAAEVKFSHNNLRFILVCELRRCIAPSWLVVALKMNDSLSLLLQAVAQSPRPMELVVSSVCPEIFGHDFVKLGMTLALFGNSCTYFAKLHDSALTGWSVLLTRRWCTKACG